MESWFSENDSRPLSPDSTQKYLAGCLGDPRRTWSATRGAR